MPSSSISYPPAFLPVCVFARLGVVRAGRPEIQASMRTSTKRKHSLIQRFSVHTVDVSPWVLFTNQQDAEAKSDFRHLPLPSSPPSTGQEENQFGRRATPPPTTASSTKTSFQRSSVKQGVISRQVRPALTEGNVDRMFAANGVGCPGAPAFGGGTRGADSDVGEGTPWVSEMGAVERVRRYMAGRHGERAARQIRLDNVTRNLLHAM